MNDLCTFNLRPVSRGWVTPNGSNWIQRQPRLNEKYKPALYCISILRRYFCEKLQYAATNSFISCFTSATVFLKAPTIDYLVLFSEDISGTAILTAIFNF